LLDAGALVEKGMRAAWRGSTPLIDASMIGREDILHAWLSRFPDEDVNDAPTRGFTGNRMTALHQAVEIGPHKIETARVLLAAN
jgi:hypothetical protein